MPRKEDLSVRGFVAGRDDQSYPIEWEEITLDLRILAEDPERAITWQDTLFNFQIDMVLYQDPQDVDNHPKFLEIDWIEFIGAEEFAQGELVPEGYWCGGRDRPARCSPTPIFFFSERASAPQAIRRGHLRASRGAVGDVDGDGDADLVVAWDRDSRPRKTTGLDGGVQRRARRL